MSLSWSRCVHCQVRVVWLGLWAHNTTSLAACDPGDPDAIQIAEPDPRRITQEPALTPERRRRSA